MTLREEVMAALMRAEKELPIRNLSSRQCFGEHPSVFYGTGIDFYQFSEYDQERHTLNQIDWHRAAQPGETTKYVREARETKDLRVQILADLSSSGDFGTKPSKRKLLLECAGMLGLTAVNVQDRVGLVGFTDEVVLEESPRGGSDQVYCLVSRLCDFFERVSARERRGTNFEKAFKYVREQCMGTTLVVVLSDFIGMEHLAESPLLKQRNPRHEFIFLILYDPEEFTAKSRLGSVWMEDMETGKKVLVPMRKLSALRKHIEEQQKQFRKALQKIGIDSAVLIYGEHVSELAKFFAERKERS